MSEDIKKEVSEEIKQSHTPEETQLYIKQLREENKEVRLKLEAKLQEEAEAKKKALEEQGKYKELYESKDKEISETVKRLEELQKERDEAVKVRDSFIENTRNDLLKDLPEEHKEIAQSLDLEKLRRYKELIGVKSKTDKATDVKPKVSFKPVSPWKEELSKIKL